MNGSANEQAWFLYLVECADGSIYTGVAIDVAARYTAHASGKGARYTRMHPPIRLLVSLELPNRSSALKAEWQIKRLSAAEKRRLANDPEALRAHLSSLSNKPG